MNCCLCRRKLLATVATSELWCFEKGGFEIYNIHAVNFKKANQSILAFTKSINLNNVFKKFRFYVRWTPKKYCFFNDACSVHASNEWTDYNHSICVNLYHEASFFHNLKSIILIKVCSNLAYNIHKHIGRYLPKIDCTGVIGSKWKNVVHNHKSWNISKLAQTITIKSWCNVKICKNQYTQLLRSNLQNTAINFDRFGFIF